MRLRVGHQHSQFWPILARFLDYYSVFWSKRDFHDLGTPWCVYVSVNDTHNFGQFLVCFFVLLLTVLASQSGFHYLQSVGAFAFLSSTLTVLANSDAICGLLLII